MSYWNYFSEDAVLESVTSTEMNPMLEEILVAMQKAGSLSPAIIKRVRTAMADKVAAGATGAIGHGVAVPHVKVPGVKATVAAFGRANHGVDFSAGDGAPVTLCFFVVGPEDAPAGHLSFLRWIAGLARDPDFPRFARQCKSRAELVDLLKEMGSKETGGA